MKLRDKISELTKYLVNERNGIVLGQCLSAVGNVNGTIPSDPEILDNRNKILELPMTELAGLGISVGISFHRPVIHVIRFQSFLALQSSYIMYYLSRAKELWDYDLPIWIRAIADEPYHGPIHSNNYHSLFNTGIKVIAPTNYASYHKYFYEWLKTKQPYLVSEHRDLYSNAQYFSPVLPFRANILLVCISNTILNANKAAKQFHNVAVICHEDLNSREFYQNLTVDSYRAIIILDSTYPDCSVAKSLAYDVMMHTGIKTHILTMEPRIIGVSEDKWNQITVERIVDKIKNVR